MAILSKIRERSMFLILVIGLALFAFVLDPSTIGDFFSASKVNEIGQVDGEAISRQEFANALETYKAQTGGRVSEMQAAKSVWNNLVREKIYSKQLKEAGITVGEADIMNALYDTQFIQNDPRFQSAGVFDKNKLKEFLALSKSENNQDWKNWQNYMVSVKKNLEKKTYDNLVGAGLGASLQEGEVQYLTNNTKVNADFVYVPYTTVADSLIKVTKSEIQAYIDNHKSEFEVEASRDISYVKFDVLPSTEDENAIKTEVAKLLEDKEEYSTATKGNVTIKGLKNTTNYKDFVINNKSDLPLNQEVQFKSQVPQVIVEDLFKADKGATFGPYKDNGYFKITKVTDVLQMPDSVKARHILIPFVGSRSATAETTLTKEKAKAKADSLLTVVKRSPSKFSGLAKELSEDKSNAEKGGDLGWFAYNAMVPTFRDYSFQNKKGDMGVVESPFGFHIISIEDQKGEQTGVKLATFGRKIEASEVTENTVFQNAESFALDVSKGKKIEEVAKEKQLATKPAVGLKALDENIPGIGKERQIITWAFGKDAKIGDYKRFDIDGGYVVATLTGKIAKGLTPVEKATSKVRPLVVKKKKAAIIEAKMSGASLADIAKASNQSVRKASLVNLKSPSITGVGYEPKIVGAMINAKENKLINNVVGDKGVFAFQVTGKEMPTTLPNYDTERKRIANQRKNQTYRMFEALKKSANVEDNVKSFYGI